MISFKTKVIGIGSWTIIRLPKEQSAKLPSRGQVMVEGSVNGRPLQSPLEPDGQLSHWFRLDKALLDATGLKVGDDAELAISPVKNWPEPDIPTDLAKALQNHAEANALWKRITPMARWEWLRWIRSTGRSETRAKRIEVACSKLEAGERRPCCWNRNLCTEPSVSKNGMLLLPTS